jgi:hypothetical protein
MSAPLHFAGAGSPGITITPSVTITKGWDSRWAAIVLAFLVWVAIIGWTEKYFSGSLRPPD